MLVAPLSASTSDAQHAHIQRNGVMLDVARVVDVTGGVGVIMTMTCSRMFVPCRHIWLR